MTQSVRRQRALHRRCISQHDEHRECDLFAASRFRRVLSSMALTATIFTFEIDLADVDRGVYESLTLKVAQHPSETEDYLLTRVLAYCLEYREGIAFSKGLSEPDEPPVVVRDLTGALMSWIEIGNPDAARLHKASKASPRVVIYTHKDPAQLKRAVAGERVHKLETIEVHAVDRQLLADLAQRLERRMKMGVTRTDGELYIAVDSDSLGGALQHHSLSTAS